MELNKQKTSEPMFILLLHYKTIWWNGEKNDNIEKKSQLSSSNKNITQIQVRYKSMRIFNIEIYSGRPLYEIFFIALILQEEEIMIGQTKKLVASYAIEDLVILD